MLLLGGVFLHSDSAHALACQLAPGPRAHSDFYTIMTLCGDRLFKLSFSGGVVSNIKIINVPYVLCNIL